MPLQAGSFIKSTQTLNDTYFDTSTILITKYNNDGATGFVTNKLFSRKLNELEEFRQVPAFPLYEGGPVDQEHLFFIHRRPDLIDNGNSIANGVYFGGNFKQVVSCIKNNSIIINDIKIFIGYCGWHSAELDEEINEGSWIISEDAGDLFAV